MRKTSGFTLVELTVVLLILVALAGILIPKVTGYVERSHASSSSSNIGEINKFVQLHEVKYLGDGYGSRFDSLLNAAETGAFDGLEASIVGASVAASEPVFVGTLNSWQQDALFNAGIKQIAAMEDSAQDKTFAPYETTPADEFLTLDSSVAGVLGNAVFLTTSHAATLGLNGTDENYVVFGLGARSTLVGRVMSDAPLHFDSVDPKTTYSRFFVVFAVPATQAAYDAGFGKARFVGSLGAEGGGMGDHLSAYYGKDAQ